MANAHSLVPQLTAVLKRLRHDPNGLKQPHDVGTRVLNEDELEKLVSVITKPVAERGFASCRSTV
jgi:hypothetical protein